MGTGHDHSHAVGRAEDRARLRLVLAVTIPTVDPHRGRLFGLAVQLPTLVRDEAGNEFPVPHAEWSVRTVWP